MPIDLAALIADHFDFFHNIEVVTVAVRTAGSETEVAHSGVAALQRVTDRAAEALRILAYLVGFSSQQARPSHKLVAALLDSTSLR